MRLITQSWIPTPLIPRNARPTIEIAPVPATSRFPALAVTGRLLWWGATVLWLRLSRRGSAREYGRRFRLLLEDLGGLWVKLGQLLSLRVDLFPLEFCQELSQLQVKAIGFPPAEAMRIIEEELESPIERLFVDFEEAPVAAASIGQVHLARLRESGVRVAVKVQRPRLRWMFREQMRAIRWFARLLQLIRFRPHMRWDELIWELDHIMLEEMDCRYEASSTRRMRRNLKRHDIYVPKVFYASQRVLVTEFIDGVLMTDYIQTLGTDPDRLRHWLAANGIDPHVVGRHLSLSLLRQLIEDNLFHGDQHPGNIVLLRDNRTALIDFGTCSFTERGMLEQFRLSILALSSRDYVKAADLFLLIAGTLPADVDVQLLRQEFLQALHQWGAGTAVRELPYHDKSVTQIYNAFLRILYEHRCTMEWGLLRIRRALETLDASLMHLFPEADYTKIAETYLRGAQRRAEDLDARLTPVSTLAAFGAALEIGERIEEYTLFQAAIIRRHAQLFQSAKNKAEALLSTAVSQLAALGALAALLAAATSLAQYRAQWVTFLGADLVARLSQFPRLDWQLWVIAAAATASSSIALLRLRRRLQQHMPRAAERVVPV